MQKLGSRNNFGYGKNFKHAARQAMKLNGVEPGSVRTHASRLHDFIRFTKEHGLNARDVSKLTASHLKEYAADVARRYHHGEINEVSTAHSYITAINKVFESLTGKHPGLNPSQETGVTRSEVRAIVPTGLDSKQVQSVADKLAADYPRTAATIQLERTLGLRAREAALMNCKVALKETAKTGHVNITEGTKGGRGNNVDRHVPITKPEQWRALKDAAKVQGNNKNLIPPGKTWVQHYNHNRYVLNLYQDEIAKQHDLRAAYACERYRELTGHEAPICRVDGESGPDKEIDREARETISYELGHGRIDVTNSYLGK